MVMAGDLRSAAGCGSGTLANGNANDPRAGRRDVRSFIRMSSFLHITFY